MITRKYLQKELRYVASTGLLWWLRPKQGRRLNRPAGRVNKSRYVTIVIDYKQYAAHKLIWILKTGKWPKHELDHKNRKRADNRWRNLREATPQQNRWNSSLRADNISGFKGVSWHASRKKWRVRLYVARKETHLGLFTSLVAARRTYAKAAKKEYGSFACIQPN